MIVCALIAILCALGAWRYYTEGSIGFAAMFAAVALIWVAAFLEEVMRRARD